MDIHKIRRDFPALSRKVNGKSLVYLDNAATSQKPKQVIDAISGYYQKHNANVHRGIHTLSEEATGLYEEARKKVAKFINAKSEREVIFVRNASEAINLVAYAWGGKNIKSGDKVVTTIMEHHSDFVPWQQLCRERSASLKLVDTVEQGHLDIEDLAKSLSAQTKLVAVNWVSNVLGTINPVKQIAEMAHERDALVLVDGAQRAPHAPIDVQKEGFDLLAFTGHKMLGPMGIGVLWAREEILNEMDPFMFGGEMVKKVTSESTVFNDLPWRFEAGTPNVGGAVGLGAAIDYLSKLGMEDVQTHGKELVAYGLKRLSRLRSLTIYGPLDPEERGSLIAFNIDDVHPHDLATALDQDGVAVRSGQHCAGPLHEHLGVSATARASFYLYNTEEEIDRLAEGIERAKALLRV